MADLVADPDIIFVLLSLAALAFVFEAANPGMTAPGATGIALVLAAGTGLSQRPASAWGLAVLGVSAVLLGLEQLPRSRGGGPTAAMLGLMLGGFLLYPSGDGVNRWLLLTVAPLVATGGIVAARTARRVRYGRRPVHHPGDYTGNIVVPERVEGQHGQVKLDGTWWTVEANAPLVAGQRVRVTGRRGLVLLVDPVEENPCQT